MPTLLGMVGRWCHRLHDSMAFSIVLRKSDESCAAVAPQTSPVPSRRTAQAADCYSRTGDHWFQAKLGQRGGKHGLHGVGRACRRFDLPAIFAQAGAQDRRESTVTDTSCLEYSLLDLGTPVSQNWKSVLSSSVSMLSARSWSPRRAADEIEGGRGAHPENCTARSSPSASGASNLAWLDRCEPSSRAELGIACGAKVRRRRFQRRAF